LNDWLNTSWQKCCTRNWRQQRCAGFWEGCWQSRGQKRKAIRK